MVVGSVFYYLLFCSIIYLVNSLKPNTYRENLIRRRRSITRNVEIQKEELYENEKLPEDLDPVHYDLEIKTIFDNNFQFEGKLKVEVKCINSTNTIVMRAENLQIDNTTIKVTSKENVSNELNIISICHNDTTALLTIVLDKELEVNKFYFVSMDFYKSNASCFYETYEDEEQMFFLRIPNSKNGAREIFPCYDDTCKTATFSLVIIRPSDMVSASSSKLISQKIINDEWTADEYNITEEIEPSSLAMVVSNMIYKETLSKSKIKIRAWAPPLLINETEFIVKMARKALDGLEKYFNNCLPIDELNLFPVPDLGFAGQASLGALFIEWTEYFVNEYTARGNVIEMVDTIIHEISHQWFLILLSMSKDEESWTGEGFATFIAQKLLDTLTPDFKNDGNFIFTRFQVGLKADESPYIKPLTLNLENMTESEVEEAVYNNTFIYEKGSSVIYMLENHLGEDKFRQRLQVYINKTLASHSCIENDKLWSTIGEVFSEVDVIHAFNSWSLQPGFPVVTIFRDYENNVTNIYQRRFVKLANTSLTNHILMTPVESYTWDIPITYTSMHERNWTKPNVFWLTEKNITSKEMFTPKNEWIVSNIKYTGFYRVNYDSHNWDLIIEQLKNDTQTFGLPQTRAAMIDDAFHLAEHGLLDYERLLNLANSLSEEKAFLPWKTLIENLQILVYRVVDKCALRRLVKLVIKILKPSYEEYGWHSYDGQSLKRLKSSIIVDFMCKMGYKDCVSESHEHFLQYLRNETTNNISAFMPTIICNEVRFGNYSKFKTKMKKMFNNNETTYDENEQLFVVMCLREQEHLKSIFELVLNSNDSTAPFLSSLFDNPAGSSLLHSYFTTEGIANNCSELLSFDYFSLMKSRWRTDDELKLVETLIDVCSEDGVLSIGFKNLLNEVTFNNQWLKKYGDDIGLILQKFDNNKATCSNLDRDIEIEI